MDFPMVQLSVFTSIYIGVILFRFVYGYLGLIPKSVLSININSETSVEVCMFLIGFGYGGVIATMFQASMVLALLIAFVGGLSNLMCSSYE